MSILDKINDDFKTALKAKDTIKLSTLRMFKAEVLKKEKESKDAKVGDDEAMAILQKMVKQHKDSIEQFTNGGRTELAEKEAAELVVLETYLPEAVSEEEIAVETKKVVESTGASSAKEMGKVMGMVMKALKATGKTVDGNAVRVVVQKLLAE